MFKEKIDELKKENKLKIEEITKKLEKNTTN